MALGLLVASASACPYVRAEEPTLPVPPQQNAPWNPPETSLPRFLNTATATLFEQGLADPRGCEYRAITLQVGSVWSGDGGKVKTSGWVLPGDDGKPRHAIAWNGLVYPVIDVGEPADLDKDLHDFTQADADVNGGPNGRPAIRAGFGGFGTNNEGTSVAVATRQPIKICLLLRLGRADLAEAVWAVGTGSTKQDGPGPKIDLRSYGVSYLTLAQDFAWYQFDRAICAHMRGDDELALADARALTNLEREIERKADAMGFPRQNAQLRGGKVVPYVAFLDQLPELLDDQERRAKERADGAAKPQPGGWENQIATKIRELDQIKVRQWGQPGGVFLGESPIIKDLIAQGDAAVQPLIDDFRKERRLTRSVGFHRDFSRHRVILRADQAAYAAIVGILKTEKFGPEPPPRKQRTRDEVADQIQGYWNQNKSIPFMECLYRTLADDKADPTAWLETAGMIVQPENVKTIPGTGAFLVTETRPLKPGEAPQLRGESLRDGHDPSVTALMVRRIDQLLKIGHGPQSGLDAACRMAKNLIAWEPAAAIPTLRELSRTCRSGFAQSLKSNDRTSRNLAISIARFTVARDAAGDHDALREYADWVRTTSPNSIGSSLVALFEPMIRHPDDPDLAAAATWLFSDEMSPWIPLVGKKSSDGSFHVVQLIASAGMLQIPAFRDMVLKSLDDRSVSGKASLDANHIVSTQLDNGFSMGRSAPKDDPDRPALGTSVPMRMCDFYAWQLASIKDFPTFNPCWPEARRDVGIQATKDHLKAGKFPDPFSVTLPGFQ
jgi:hypothetical protein